MSIGDFFDDDPTSVFHRRPRAALATGPPSDVSVVELVHNKSSHTQDYSSGPYNGPTHFYHVERRLGHHTLLLQKSTDGSRWVGKVYPIGSRSPCPVFGLSGLLAPERQAAVTKEQVPKNVCVVEFVEGGTLYTQLHRTTFALSLTEPQIGFYAVQLLLALFQLQQRRVNHGGVFPANIFLHESGVLKLGYHKEVRGAQSPSLALNELSPQLYMAPEVLAGAPISDKSDMWSFGVVLYEMLAGCHPFQAATVGELSTSVRCVAPPLPGYCSEEMRSVVASVLRIEPSERPTAEVLLRDPWISCLLLMFETAAYRNFGCIIFDVQRVREVVVSCPHPQGVFEREVASLGQPKNKFWLKVSSERIVLRNGRLIPSNAIVGVFHLPYNFTQGVSNVVAIAYRSALEETKTSQMGAISWELLRVKADDVMPLVGMWKKSDAARNNVAKNPDEQAWETIENMLQRVLRKLKCSSNGECTSPPGAKTAQFPDPRPTEWHDAVYHQCSANVSRTAYFIKSLVAFVKAIFLESKQSVPSTIGAREYVKAFGREYAMLAELQRFNEHAFMYLTQLRGPNFIRKLHLSQLRDSFESYVPTIADAIHKVVEEIRGTGETSMDPSIVFCVRICIDCDALPKLSPVAGKQSDGVEPPEATVVSLYTEYIEKPYIEKMKQYFLRQVAQMKSDMSFVHWAERCAADEQKRAARLLPHTTVDKVVEGFREVVLSPKSNDLIRKNLSNLLQEGRLEDAATLHSLLKPCPRAEEAMGEVVAAMANEQFKRLRENFMQSSAAAPANKTRSAVSGLVNEVLALLRTWTQYIRDCFHCSDTIAKCLRKGAADALQGEYAKDLSFSTLLALYFDVVISSSSSGESANNSSDPCLLLELLPDRDDFLASYRMYLSHRLLAGPSNESALEREREMIAQLQKVVGLGVSHCISMLNNIEACNDELHQQANASQLVDLPKIQVHYYILTHSVWPPFPNCGNLVLTPALRQHIDFRTMQYRKKYSARVLRWVHSACRATLSIHYPKGVKTVDCGLLAAMVLIHLDANGPQSTKAIIAAVKCIETELTPCLTALVQLKMIVTKERNIGGSPNASSDAVDAVYALNEQFTSNSTKIRVSNQPLVQKAQANELMQWRLSRTYSTIVRILKARKKMYYKELFAAVGQQLATFFTVDVQLMKRALEYLLESNYLCRSQDCMDCFEYLA